MMNAGELDSTILMIDVFDTFSYAVVGVFKFANIYVQLSYNTIIPWLLNATGDNARHDN